MFNRPDLPKTLDDETFKRWLEDGRLNRSGYKYLLVIWDELESQFRPVYTENRDEIDRYLGDKPHAPREILLAGYDLYSESKIA